MQNLAASVTCVSFLCRCSIGAGSCFEVVHSMLIPVKIYDPCASPVPSIPQALIFLLRHSLSLSAMDGFSGAFAVLEASVRLAKVVHGAYNFVIAIKNAPQELANLIKLLSILQDLIDNVRKIISNMTAE